MPRDCINSNQLGAGLEAAVGDNTIAWARVTSLGTWTNAAFKLRHRAAGGGPFGDFATPVAIAAADNGKLFGPYNVAGLDRLRLEPTTVETSGASPAAVFVEAEIVLSQATISV